MCLTKIKEIYDQPSTMVMDGWKEFNGGATSKPQFSLFTLKGSKEVPLDNWCSFNLP